MRIKTMFAIMLLCGIILVLSGMKSSGAVLCSYDAIHRLTHVDYDNGTSIAYTYDAAGNRMTLLSKATGNARSPIPGKIEVENYDIGGSGITYYDSTSGNAGGQYRTDDVDVETCSEGGYDVGYVVAGEWLVYSVSVQETDSYRIDARVACSGAGGTFHIEVDDQNVTGSLTVPNTGGWQTWATVSKSGVMLTVGAHQVKLVMDTPSSGRIGNFNYLNITREVVGSLMVTLSPAGAVGAGAQWQVDGGSWQSSGTIVSGLSIGSHLVAFNVLSSYNSPVSQSVTIVDGQTTNLSVTYTAVPGDGTGAGLLGEYFANTNFTGYQFCRIDTNVNFYWGLDSPSNTLGVDDFAIRWSGQIQPKYSEEYTFYTLSDDGVRLRINNQVVIDKWIRQSAENNGRITLVGGQKYDISLEYFEYNGIAQAKLYWSSARRLKEIIPTGQLYPALANAPPVANGQVVSLTEDSTTSIVLSGIDPEHVTLVYTVLSGPNHGSLSGSAPTYTYSPAPNYFGADSLTFKVNDGLQDSLPATISITVTPVNDPPTADSKTIVTRTNRSVTVTFSGNDVEGSNLIYTVLSMPTNGVLTGSGSTRLYTPNRGFEGADLIVYKANDGQLDSQIANILINVRRVLSANDHDGDSRSDMPIFDPKGGYWYIQSLTNGTLIWKNQWGWSTARPVVGDYDGDGLFDQAVFDTQGGYWYIKSLAGATILWANQWGWSTAKPVPGDYDGDGAYDQAVFDTQGGYWYIKSISGNSIAWANQWGWSTAKPVPGDYDGDGKWDQAVFDTQGGYWYIKSVAGNTILWANQWGWSTAKPVPGDYDGDGKFDQAVFDTVGGYWYIKSVAGNIITWKNQWGWSTAKPIPGDYNGDGKFDLAVYDTATGLWYIKGVDGTIIAWAVQWGWPGATVPALGD